MADLIRIALAKRGFTFDIPLQKLLCEPAVLTNLGGPDESIADFLDENDFEKMLRVLEG